MSRKRFIDFITITIMSTLQHRSPRPSLDIRLHRPSHPAGLPVYILYWHRAVIYRFKLVVLPLLVYVKGSTVVCHKFVLTSPAVSRMSRSSNSDSLCDGWSVAVYLLFCGVLPPDLVQYFLQHSCIIAVKIFLHTFS